MRVKFNNTYIYLYLRTYFSDVIKHFEFIFSSNSNFQYICKRHFLQIGMESKFVYKGRNQK